MFGNLLGGMEEKQEAMRQKLASATVTGTADGITVTANGSDVTVRGWAKGPLEESKARYVASTVPGVTNAYSTVRTYSNESSK